MNPPKFNFIPRTQKEEHVANIFSNPANYKLDKVLGEGGFGKVYLAIDKNGDKYAVKIMPLNMPETEKELIFREANITRGLHLKNVIKNYGIFAIPIKGVIHTAIVSEYYPGQLLDHYIRHCTDLLSERSMMILMLQVMSGIYELHNDKIAHMDIKDNNIIVSGKNIKILDLGLACRADIPEFSKCHLGGTPPYMAPEIFLGNLSDPYKADIWSFGVIFYYLVYDFFPFPFSNRGGATDSQIMGAQKKGTSYPILPNFEPVIDIIKYCLVYDYRSRPSAFKVLQYINKKFI